MVGADESTHSQKTGRHTDICTDPHTNHSMTSLGPKQTHGHGKYNSLLDSFFSHCTNFILLISFYGGKLCTHVAEVIMKSTRKNVFVKTPGKRQDLVG